jgi:hypothetical protein
MANGRLHRSGFRIIDGGLTTRARSSAGAGPASPCPRSPAFRLLDAVVSYLLLPGEEAPAILILPAHRHRAMVLEDWRLIERGCGGGDRD